LMGDMVRTRSGLGKEERAGGESERRWAQHVIANSSLPKINSNCMGYAWKRGAMEYSKQRQEEKGESPEKLFEPLSLQKCRKICIYTDLGKNLYGTPTKKENGNPRKRRKNTSEGGNYGV